MWKPGTAQPVSGKNSNKNKKTKTKNEASSPLQGSGSILASSKESSKATPKRLSGATMNMRFMKRKQETQEQEKERKRLSVERAEASAALEPSILSPSAPPQISAVVASTKGSDEGGDDMDIDDDGDDDEPTSRAATSTTIEAYQVATPIDMYGVQAALLGRRSFGGFNPAVEEAWKESKASLELDSPLDRRPKNQQATDDELIQRYQDIVKKRSESSRAVGNLRDKSKRQRR